MTAAAVHRYTPDAAHVLSEASGGAAPGSVEAPLTIVDVRTEADEQGDPRVIAGQPVVLPHCGLVAQRVGALHHGQLRLSGGIRGAHGVTIEVILDREDLRRVDALMPLYPDKGILVGAVQRLNATVAELRASVERERAGRQESAALLRAAEDQLADLTLQLERATSRSRT